MQACVRPDMQFLRDHYVYPPPGSVCTERQVVLADRRGMCSQGLVLRLIRPGRRRGWWSRQAGKEETWTRHDSAQVDLHGAGRVQQLCSSGPHGSAKWWSRAGQDEIEQIDDGVSPELFVMCLDLKQHCETISYLDKLE
eukprot:749816-Hanusia_phi.AAC.8